MEGCKGSGMQGFRPGCKGSGKYPTVQSWLPLLDPTVSLTVGPHFWPPLWGSDWLGPIVALTVRLLLAPTVGFL